MFLCTDFYMFILGRQGFYVFSCFYTYKPIYQFLMQNRKVIKKFCFITLFDDVVDHKEDLDPRIHAK